MSGGPKIAAAPTLRRAAGSQSASPTVTACTTTHWLSSARAMAPTRTRQ